MRRLRYSVRRVGHREWAVVLESADTGHVVEYVSWHGNRWNAVQRAWSLEGRAE